MAKRESGSGGFGWLLLGLLAGVALSVAAYLYVTRGADHEKPPVDTAPSVQMKAPALPAEPAPVAAAIKPDVPAVAAPPKAPTSRDAQIEDDAAATGMTGPATPEEPPADKPTN